MSDLMTLDEVAVAIRVSKKTLLNWRSARRPGLPVGFRPAGGRTVLYRREDVEQWIHEQLEAARTA